MKETKRTNDPHQHELSSEPRLASKDRKSIEICHYLIRFWCSTVLFEWDSWIAPSTGHRWKRAMERL